RDDELRGYPKAERRGGTRVTPDVEMLAERLKNARTQKADELQLPRGTLLSNATLLEIARVAPKSVGALAAVEGMRRWKAEVLGEDFLKLIR
ncbi:MAG TPA: HRDC domain-containing protein, partial [Vicinamibacteria bacterium]